MLYFDVNCTICWITRSLFSKTWNASPTTHIPKHVPLVIFSETRRTKISFIGFEKRRKENHVKILKLSSAGTLRNVQALLNARFTEPLNDVQSLLKIIPPNSLISLQSINISDTF